MTTASGSQGGPPTTIWTRALAGARDTYPFELDPNLGEPEGKPVMGDGPTRPAGRRGPAVPYPLFVSHRYLGYSVAGRIMGLPPRFLCRSSTWITLYANTLAP